MQEESKDPEPVMAKPKQTSKPKKGKVEKDKSENSDKADVNKTSKSSTGGRQSVSRTSHEEAQSSGAHDQMSTMIKNLVDENKKMLAGMLQSLKEEFSQTVAPKTKPQQPKAVNDDEAGTSSGSIQPTKAGRSGKFDYREDADSDNGSIELHPNYEQEGIDDNEDPPHAETERSDHDDSVSEAGTTCTEYSGAGDIEWTSTLKQLPQYYGGKLEIQGESSKGHTSYVSSTFQMGKKNTIPKLPLEGEVKDKWDTVEKFMKKGKISSFRASDNHKFRIYESDFEQYGCVPQIDQEFKAKVELENQKMGKNSGGKRSKQPPIKDPQLRKAEMHLQKCDESARVALRASSHGMLMLNAMNTILEDPNQYEQGEMTNLIKGTVRCLQAATDCAVRVTARSIMARREICLSQIHFKDSNASSELMSLPIGGQHLFQGKFSETMHKYATFSRDARETSDYASTTGTKRTYDPQTTSGPPHKKQATTSAGAPKSSDPPKRTLTFKGNANTSRPSRGRGRGSNPRFQFQRKQDGKGPTPGQQN